MTELPIHKAKHSNSKLLGILKRQWSNAQARTYFEEQLPKLNYRKQAGENVTNSPVK